MLNAENNLSVNYKPLTDLLDKPSSICPDKICVDFLGRKYSYRQISDLVDRTACGMQNLGITKGTKVGIMLPNSPQFIINYFAILKIGAVVIPYNYKLSIQELKNQINITETEFIVTTNLAEFYSKLCNLLQETSIYRAIICNFYESLPFPNNYFLSWLKWQEVINISPGRKIALFNKLIKNDGNYIPPKINPQQDIASILCINNKDLLLLTHHDINSKLEKFSDLLGEYIDENDSFIGILPLFHIFSLTSTMLLSFYRRTKIILIPQGNTELLIGAISLKKPTILIGVATIFQNIINMHNINNFDLTSLKLCISAYSTIEEGTKCAFEDRAECKIYEIYP